MSKTAIIGYARASTDDQKLEAQLDSLNTAGAVRIYSDKTSGTMKVRPELQCALEQLRGGDVLIVTKYDRFGS